MFSFVKYIQSEIILLFLRTMNLGNGLALLGFSSSCLLRSMDQHEHLSENLLELKNLTPS